MILVQETIRALLFYLMLQIYQTDNLSSFSKKKKESKRQKFSVIKIVICGHIYNNVFQFFL